MVYAGTGLNLEGDRTRSRSSTTHGSHTGSISLSPRTTSSAPKTSVRGDVYEAYVTDRITKNFIGKLSFIHYDYAYSNSGFPLGAPKNLDEDAGPRLPRLQERPRWSHSG